MQEIHNLGFKHLRQNSQGRDELLDVWKLQTRKVFVVENIISDPEIIPTTDASTTLWETINYNQKMLT